MNWYTSWPVQYYLNNWRDSRGLTEQAINQTAKKERYQRLWGITLLAMKTTREAGRLSNRKVLRRPNCIQLPSMGSLTEPFEATTGAQQWCLLSPLLFLVALDWVTKTAFNRLREFGRRWLRGWRTFTLPTTSACYRTGFRTPTTKWRGIS